MTVRELEQIDSGLKILSYECDEVLNSGSLGNNFFHLYFNYTGFIIHLKNRNWKVNEIKKTLLKFPRLTQPVAMVFVPMFFYAMGLYFTSSLIAVLAYFVFISTALYLSYLLVKKKMKRDLLKVISLCSELRLNIHKSKNLFHDN